MGMVTLNVVHFIHYSLVCSQMHGFASTSSLLVMTMGCGSFMFWGHQQGGVSWSRCRPCGSIFAWHDCVELGGISSVTEARQRQTAVSGGVGRSCALIILLVTVSEAPWLRARQALKSP